jgi:hypothetical protein
VPVLVVKERQGLGQAEASPQIALPLDGQPRSRLVDRGHLAGEPLRRCLPILRSILERVCDETEVPAGLERYLTQEGLKWALSGLRVMLGGRPGIRPYNACWNACGIRRDRVDCGDLMPEKDAYRCGTAKPSLKSTPPILISLIS